MTEIEKMKKYIERTKLPVNGYQLCWPETCEMVRTAIKTDDVIAIIALAFDYGKAKGYRAAKAKKKLKEAIT